VIVFIESNYVLELAFLQAEENEALKLLELAERKLIRLVIPAYALVEPLEKLKRVLPTFASTLSMAENELARAQGKST
jgi:predicted nucleic acid-binding protein